MPKTHTNYQLYLDHLFPKSEPNIRLDEFAKRIGFTFGFVWKLWDEGIIWGNNHHGTSEGFAALKKSKATRKDLNLKYRYTQTITREAAIYYLTTTSNCTDEIKLQRFIEALDAFSPAQLLTIATAAQQKAVS